MYVYAWKQTGNHFQGGAGGNVGCMECCLRPTGHLRRWGDVSQRAEVRVGASGALGSLRVFMMVFQGS